MSEQLIEFRAEMESSLLWRLEEYRRLKNTIKEDNKVAVVKVLIVMLYAHFGGFYKDCMDYYIDFINSTQLELECLNTSLIAASLHREFSSFEDTNRKCRELTTTPPVEDYLHRFHRRKELTKIFNTSYLTKKVKIKDLVVNTKSNLSFQVWQENFYILGLDVTLFSDYQKNIDKLVNLRNNIAHGSQKEPLDYSEFDSLEFKIIELMEKLIVYLYEYCFENKYMKINEEISLQ